MRRLSATVAAMFDRGEGFLVNPPMHAQGKWRAFAIEPRQRSRWPFKAAALSPATWLVLADGDYGGKLIESLKRWPGWGC